MRNRMMEYMEEDFRRRADEIVAALRVYVHDNHDDDIIGSAYDYLNALLKRDIPFLNELKEEGRMDEYFECFGDYLDEVEDEVAGLGVKVWGRYGRN
jgi:hypothetical protein